MAALSKDAAFWSKISRKYAADPIQNMEGYLNTLTRTKSYLKPDDHVLEVGCGTGSTALLLAPLVGHITGTDVAPGMIEIAEEKRADAGAQNVSFKVLEVSEHPAGDGPYDVVLAHNLLHLVADLDGALAHLSAQTKPGGYFISKTVCAPRRGGLRYGLVRRIAIPVMQMIGKAPYVDFRTAEALERAIARAGFDLIEGIDQEGMLLSRYVVARKSS